MNAMRHVPTHVTAAPRPLRMRPRPLRLRATVVVPCVAKHARHLPELLAHLEQQTVLPDEVAISVSEGPAPFLRSARFRVIVVANLGRAYAGRNRNLAAAASTGDILVYQDADDLPHPQRVEMAHALLERCVVHHVLHRYDHLQCPRSTAEWSESRYQDAPRLARYEPGGYTFTPHYTNGNPITSRLVFDRVRWPENMRRGQDVAYNELVAGSFRRVMARLDVPLLSYRQYLSSR